MTPGQQIRALARQARRARDAYREENHCGDCDAPLDLMPKRRTGRKCEECKRATNRAASARGYERRRA